MRFGALSREGSSLIFFGKTKRQLHSCLNDIKNHSIQEFVVECDSFTDRHLEILLERQTPLCLILRYTRVTEFGVGLIVERCRSVLQKLSLYGGYQIQENGIRRLSECGKLLSLDVSYTNLNGLDLKYLSRNLRELSISGLDLTYDELESVTRYTNLNYLRGDHLESCSQALFVALSSLLNLRFLYLDNCDLVDDDIMFPDRYQSLRTLSLAGNDIGIQGVARLSEIPNLQSLKLNGNFKIGCNDSYLTLPRSLLALELESCNLSNDAIKNIIRCSGLRSLRLSNNDDINHKSLLKLKALRDLKKLSLSWTNLDNLGINAMAGLKGLELLNLENTNLEGRDLYRLAKNPTLQQLIIRGTPAANDTIAQNDLRKRFMFIETEF